MKRYTPRIKIARQEPAGTVMLGIEMFLRDDGECMRAPDVQALAKECLPLIQEIISQDCDCRECTEKMALVAQLKAIIEAKP